MNLIALILKRLPILCIAIVAFVISGCATLLEPSTDARAETESAEWRETSLYFGLRRVGDDAPFTGLTESRWIQFLDEEVSTRFPAGFTVVDGYGQWMHMDNLDKTPNRLESKVIILLHPDTTEADALIDAVRVVFTTQFEQESVLRATVAAEVSF